MTTVITVARLLLARIVAVTTLITVSRLLLARIVAVTTLITVSRLLLARIVAVTTLITTLFETRTIHLPEDMSVLLDATNLQSECHCVENLVEIDGLGTVGCWNVGIIPEFEHVATMTHLGESIRELLVELLSVFQSFRIDVRREPIVPGTAIHAVGISGIGLWTGGLVIRTAGTTCGGIRL
jgi:hypothetical protein